MKQYIIAMRHSQKTKNDKGIETITAWGAQQIFAAILALPTMWTSKTKLIVTSGVLRADQCGQIARTALWSLAVYPEIEIQEDFDFQSLLKSFDDPKVALAPIAEVRKTDDRIVACKETPWVKAASERVTQALLALATEMAQRNEEVALVISHSPYIETAATGEFSDEIPAGIFEADVVVYEIEGGEIITSLYIKAPLDGGQRN